MSKHLFAVCFFLLSFNSADAVSLPPGDTSPSVSAMERHNSEPPPASAVALVVGNSGYPDRPLRTPAADARAVARLLENKGFDVIRLENATRDMLQQALRQLTARAGETGTALFYFAGHGLQTDESALILPVDADTASADAVRRTAVSVEQVLALMSSQRPGKPNLVIIDSCLNNPYRRPPPHTPLETGYLPRLPEQTLLAFATAPGAVAYDGGGQQGIYARALLDVLQQPGLAIGAAFDQVSRRVGARTDRQQVPWTLSTLDTVLKLDNDAAPGHHPPTAPQRAAISLPQLAAMPVRGILPKDSDAQYELEFWQSIKDSTDASDYEAYLEAFPDGKFAPLAKARAKRYKKSAPKPTYSVTDMDAEFEAVRNANIRETPSRKSRLLGDVRKGDRIRVTGQLADKQWYRVRSGGITGYVFADLLRKPAPKPVKKPVKKPVAKPAPVARPAPPPTPPRAKLIEVRELQDCSSCPVLLTLPGGSFTMGEKRGDRSEQPAHTVSIGRPFAIGKFEVTVAQWNECVKAGACGYQPDLGNPEADSPIRDISWSDAQEYVAWLSKVTGKEYRLPTEAEWEYAARGGTQTRFWWGNGAGVAQADCKNCGGKWNRKAPASVDGYPANPFGLHGTSGGVWEWVADCWHKTYKNAPANGRAWNKSDCRENVIRGGAWRNDSSYVHSASRFKYDTHVRYLMNGFRVARTLP